MHLFMHAHLHATIHASIQRFWSLKFCYEFRFLMQFSDAGVCARYLHAPFMLACMNIACRHENVLRVLIQLLLSSFYCNFEMLKSWQRNSNMHAQLHALFHACIQKFSKIIIRKIWLFNAILSRVNLLKLKKFQF